MDNPWREGLLQRTSLQPSVSPFSPLPGQINVAFPYEAKAGDTKLRGRRRTSADKT